MLNGKSALVTGGSTGIGYAVAGCCRMRERRSIAGRDRARGEAATAALGPSGRIVTPEDVAAVVMRLFAGDAGIENGGALLVDAGGATIPVTPTAASAHVT